MLHDLCRIVGSGRTAALTLLVVLTVAALGCESAPSVEQRRRGFKVPDAEYAKLGYRVDWIGYPVVTTREGLALLTPYDDVVLALDGGGNVTAMSAANGSARWSDQVASDLTQFVGLQRSGNRVIASAEGDVYQLDLDTGNLLNRQAYEKIVSTAPVLYSNLAIYGTGSGELMAHLLSSPIPRVKQWGHALPGAIDFNPVLIGQTVGAVSQQGVVVFVDAASGSLVGRNQMYRGVATHPVASSGAMFVASLDQSVYAFRPEGGLLIWQYRTPVPLRQQPTVRGKAVFVGVDGVGLVALDTARGTVLWTAKGVRGTVIGATKNRLVVWDGKTATLLDADRGDVIERVDLPKLRMLKFDKPEDGNLYAVSESGVVAKFVPR